MMRRKTKDCGCGGGKNCVTKAALTKFVKSELKRLDCGCGCKGEKGFCGKYGMTSKQYIGGNILADCPPGWRNDGLTCVEPCAADERDDGLTCRKKCLDGWIDDGLTCRKPITSSMNECPAGSKDVAGTCWGPVRKDCIHDCFKHPARGCRTYQCGRLRGAFGEDWGPKWCTDCDLNCGKTCWDVQGITKQLHERDLKVMGGEVLAQAIRTKIIRGRVNFDALLREIGNGLEKMFTDDQFLALLFDPEKNGINAAFRKFGDDMKRVLEEVNNKIKDGFRKMGDAAKAAFEEMARNAERDFKQFGEDFVHKMKDPDFWVEAVGIMAMVAGAVLSAALTVGTLGIGAPAAAGLMAAAAMAGPAARMIAAGARGEPIDALDIAELVLAGTAAVVPGLGPTIQNTVKYGTMAAQFAVAAVREGQKFGVIPTTCIANCPPEPERPRRADDMPDPCLINCGDPPAGQLTAEEIRALQPADQQIYNLRNPDGTRSVNPNYKSPAEWLEQYRCDHYNECDGREPNGAIISPEDKAIEDATKVGVPNDPVIPGERDPNIPPPPPSSAFPPKKPDSSIPPAPPSSGFPPKKAPDSGIPPAPKATPFPAPKAPEDGVPPAPKTTPFPPPKKTPVEEEAIAASHSFGEDMLEGGANIDSLPIIEISKNGDVYSNPWGTMVSTLPKSNIPPTHTGQPFDPECYGRHNPEVAAATGNDKDKLTTHWIEIGFKNGLHADCNEPTMTAEQRVEASLKIIKELETIEGRKHACAAVDSFWIESEKKCDPGRHADGRINPEGAKCVQFGSYFDKSTEDDKYHYCKIQWNENNELKSEKERCNIINGHWEDDFCNIHKNVDGSDKTDADYCEGLDNYYHDGKCDVRKNREGKPKSEEEMCKSAGNYWNPIERECNSHLYVNANPKGKRTLCNVTLNGKIDNVRNDCTKIIGEIPSNYADMETYLKTKDLVINEDTAKRFFQFGKLPKNFNFEKSGKYFPQNIRMTLIKGEGKPSKSLTLYYADWCPHCKPLIPMFKKLKIPGVEVRMLEQAENREFKVQGYPTIIYRDGSSMEEYNGSRTKADIVEFLKNKL